MSTPGWGMISKSASVTTKTLRVLLLPRAKDLAIALI